MRTTPKLVLLALFLSFVAPLNAQPQPRSQPGEDLAFEHLTVVEGLPENSVWAMLQDHLGFLWFGTQNGLAKYDGYTYTLYKPDPDDPHSLSDQRIYAIHEDAAGDLWIGTVQGGLNHFDRETERFTRYLHDPDDPTSLSHNSVFAILEDKEGTLWLSTMGGGLNRYDPDEPGRFTRYRYDPDDPNGLRDDSVHGLWEDDEGMLWIGTHDGGLHRFDPATEMFTVYQHDDEDPYSLSHNDVNTIYQDREGTFWVGTAGGLNRFDPDTGRFTHYLNDPDDAPEVTTIYEDREGVLWLGTWMNGVKRYDRAANTFTAYKHDPADSTSLSADHVGAIFEDEAGTLWFATGDGMLNRFDRAMETFRAHTPMGGQVMVRSFARSEAMPGKYWIGTNLQGLHLYDFETDTSEAFTEKNGLPHDTILGLLEDDQGYVWVGTARGLSKFDPRTKTFRTYHLADRLQGNKLMTMPVHKGRDGTFFFGGSIGFIAFHPERVTDNLYVPPVVLTDFKLFTESVSAGEDSPLKAHVSVAQEIRLAYWQNDISFTFAALNYQASEQNRYAYQLENYKDDEWRYAGAGRTATYTNLAPGEYVFRAIGSNNSDVWNDEGASIRLVITPPWWKTLWAYALFLFLGAAGLFGLIRWQVRYLERRANKLEAMVSQRTAEVVQQKATIEAQAQKLQELDRLKSRFFANISHEFRTPLLLILGPLQDALNGVYGSVNAVLRKQIEMMQRSGFRLLRLINQLLDLSKLESGNMRLQARRANLMPFLKGIVLSFSSMAERKHITFELHTEQERLDLYFDPDGSFADVELPSALPAEAPTILLVEDNPDVRAYVKTHLARHYHLDEAADGAEGLEKARLRKPDLIISDVMMPRMDGYALCRAIKTDPDLNHIPVILLTAKAGEESKVEGLETGADDYIYKPFSADELLVRAENLIEIRRLLRQRFSREVVTVQPSEITVTSADMAFLEQVQAAVEVRMANSNFGAEWLADEVGLSPRQLRRKLKALTNLSMAGYIRSMRLQRAAQLLEEQAGNVSEVAYAVGFQDPKHFSKLFRQVFGMAPSQVASI